MSVRAKFICNSYETSLQQGVKTEPRSDGKPREWRRTEDRETVECRTVKLTAVYDGSPENKEFFRFTPSGQISMGVLNPAAWKIFELNKEYYVDFTLATPPEGGGINGTN